MHFMQLLKSLDELLYEVMSWLVFFPLTLWRTLTQPITMMEYADSELHDPEEQQYEDALSPPLFLLLAILIQHHRRRINHNHTGITINDQPVSLHDQLGCVRDTDCRRDIQAACNDGGM